MAEKSYFIHESSYIDDDVEIGEGTKIWHFCHLQRGRVLESTVLWGRTSTSATM